MVHKLAVLSNSSLQFYVFKYITREIFDLSHYFWLSIPISKNNPRDIRIKQSKKNLINGPGGFLIRSHYLIVCPLLNQSAEPDEHTT